MGLASYYVYGRRGTIHQDHIEQTQSRERFEEVFEHAAVGAMLVELDGHIRQVNHSLCDLLGYTERELSGKTIQDVTHPDDLDADFEELDKLLGGEIHAYQMEKRYLHRDGHAIWGLLSRSLVRDESGYPLYFISQVQDISQRKALEEELLRLAHHDPLTGLYNRAAFGEQIERAISFAKRNEGSLALLFLDLDDFKRVNDTLGHDAGDRLLAAVASRLLTCVRAEDTVARLGGDEFCVLLEGLANTEDALQAAKRVETCLREPFTLDDYQLPYLTASIGIVAKGPGKHLSAGQLLREADTAMYQAKRCGKARHQLYLNTMEKE